MADSWRKIPGAAKRVGLSVNTFRKFLKDGLRHVQLPSGTILVKDAHVDEFLMKFEVVDQRKNGISRIVDDVMKDIA